MHYTEKYVFLKYISRFVSSKYLDRLLERYKIGLSFKQLRASQDQANKAEPISEKRAKTILLTFMIAFGRRERGHEKMLMQELFNEIGDNSWRKEWENKVQILHDFFNELKLPERPVDSTYKENYEAISNELESFRDDKNEQPS